MISSKGRRAMKRYTALPGLLLLTLVSGCFYELRDELTECKISWNNKWAAKAAWHDTQGSCMGMSCPHSFKEGFRSGYLDVANGGRGCLPAVPDIRCCNHMWLDLCSDNQKMEAWFDGYEIGALAAREGGMADANRVVSRAPQATPVDYTTPAHTPADASPIYPSSGLSIPPAPAIEPEFIGGPQTRR
jgi:hypothetical protein